MELNLKNSNLKISGQKLKSPVSDIIFIPNPLLQNVSSPSPVPNSVTPKAKTPKANNLAENQGNNTFYSDLLLRGWSKTGKRTTPGKAIPSQHPLANQHQSKGNLPLKKRKPDLPTSSNTKNIYVHKNHSEFPKQYVCNICDRSFKCYRALGGHKVHHKVKISAIDADSMVRHPEQHATHSFVHECHFCKKVFSTGQALGGHKRHCREPVPEKEEPVPGENQEKRNQKRGLNIDLNELSKEMEGTVAHM